MILPLHGRQARITALAACVLAAVLLTLPVAPHYLEMVLWYVGLFTHQGGYGSGAAGVPGLPALVADASVLVTAMPETFACLGLYLAVSAASAIGILRLPARSVRMLLVCTAFMAANLLLVLKQPEVRYTISTVPFLCLGNAIVAHYLVRDVSWARAGLVAALAILGLWSGNARTQHVAIARAGNDALIQRATQSGCLLAPYYSVNMVAFNLLFGNGWTQSFFKDRLALLYPDFLSYNNGARAFENFSGLLSQSESLRRFAKERCVYLIGSPIARLGTLGLPQSSLSLVAQSPGGPREAVALYALNPGWNEDVNK